MNGRCHGFLRRMVNVSFRTPGQPRALDGHWLPGTGKIARTGWSELSLSVDLNISAIGPRETAGIVDRYRLREDQQVHHRFFERNS